MSEQLVVGVDGSPGSYTALRWALACAAQIGAQVHVVAPVTVDGVVASSSKVREYILEGRVSAAQRLLGRHGQLTGPRPPRERRWQPAHDPSEPQ